MNDVGLKEAINLILRIYRNKLEKSRIHGILDSHWLKGSLMGYKIEWLRCNSKVD